MDAIAEQCGIDTPALRSQFQRIVGTLPGRYRSTFRRSAA
jgi:transcriptional regulator GlxA family with amidase domain